MKIEQIICEPRLSSIWTSSIFHSNYNSGQKAGDIVLFDFANPNTYIVNKNNPYGKTEDYLLVYEAREDGLATFENIRMGCYLKLGDIVKVNGQTFRVDDLAVMRQNIAVEMNLATI